MRLSYTFWHVKRGNNCDRHHHVDEESVFTLLKCNMKSTSWFRYRKNSEAHSHIANHFKLTDFLSFLFFLRRTAKLPNCESIVLSKFVWIRLSYFKILTMKCIKLAKKTPGAKISAFKVSKGGYRSDPNSVSQRRVTDGIFFAQIMFLAIKSPKT
jgi:hypothetical protein